MPMDFPASPNVGDQFASGGRVWQWNGVKWVPASTSGSGFLSLSGGTMQGELTLAADPLNPLDAATKHYVDAGHTGGFVNRLRNGTFDVWQRGTSINVGAGASLYTTDGWIVNPTGAALSVTLGDARVSPPTSGGVSVASFMSLTGNTGMTNTALWQNIESYVAAALAFQTVTFQCVIYNNTGATITPQLGINRWPSADTPAGQISDLPYTNLQPCSNGAWTRVAYTYAAGALGYGASVYLQFGGVLNTNAKQVFIAAADLRATPGLPYGLCANPPPPELRSIATELAFCQRYYQAANSIVEMVPTVLAAVAYGFPSRPLVVFMRAAPTIVYSGVTYQNCSALTSSNISAQVFRAQVTATAANAQVFVIYSFTASAEL